MKSRALTRTPDVVAKDGRGLPVRQIAYLRQPSDAAVEPLIARQYYNAMAWYKEMGTTDNQFLLKQARTNKKKAA
ncbi:hypothetical protein [Pseudomonas fluorescens]|nr:hypothetical protein [Pseudomonas fluorescens]